MERQTVSLKQCIGEVTSRQIGMNGKDYIYIDDMKKVSAETIAVAKSIQLEKEKNIKLIEINKSCTIAITSGYLSLALGVEHMYQSEEIDQINLMGAKVRGTSAPIKCSLDGGKTWNYEIHNEEQILKVYNDGAFLIEKNLLKANDIKRQLSDAKTIEDVNNIEWEEVK